MIRSTLLIFLSALVLISSSCSTGRLTAEWVERPIDGPWIAPQIHAREFEREYFAGVLDSVSTSDVVWTTATGSRRDAFQIVASVQRHLMKLGYFERWPESGSNVSGYQQRLAPFTFHIVAIEPTIVIMVPHDFGDPKGNRSINDIVGQPPKQSFQSRYMLNSIEYGTTLPFQSDILWFSPDLGTAPAMPERRTDSEMEVRHKEIRLVLKKDGDLWTTQRESS